MKEEISKEKLAEIIDGLFLQIVWVRLCLDSLEAIKSIDKNKIKKSRNFFYITCSSLTYRFSMELAKLFDEGDLWSIDSIRKACARHKEYFDDSFNVIEFCSEFKKELKQYEPLKDNIRGRRKKTYAHNDKEYYLFSKKAIDDFPIDMNQIRSLAILIYNFAYTLQQKIGSKRAFVGYPADPDDIKRIFGEKTFSDLWLLGIDDEAIKNVFN